MTEIFPGFSELNQLLRHVLLAILNNFPRTQSPVSRPVFELANPEGLPLNLTFGHGLLDLMLG